jgi:transcriptional regulator with XRE-family HTH domain
MARPRERKGPRPALAEKLRAARAARGLTQHAAAAELEISVSRLAEIESGTRRVSLLAEKYLCAWAAESLGKPYSLIRTTTRKTP